MKAMVITGYGGPEVFEEREVERPKPGPTEVLVRVHATSVNPVDYKVRQFGLNGAEPPLVLGYDVSGVVEEVGEAVLLFSPGDEVYYTPEVMPGRGSYAEYNVADEEIVARKPANLSHEEAAAIPLAGATAWDALITRGLLTVSETVLIHGAGGVGSLAIQIARAAGARVLVVCAGYMVDTARELGADQAYDYAADDWESGVMEVTEGAGVDLVFDTVGGDVLPRSIAVTKPFGRMAEIVDVEGDLSPAGAKNITVHFVMLQRLGYRLNALRGLIERGLVKPVIDTVMPLREVAKAHERIEAGGVKGKIVLRVSDS